MGKILLGTCGWDYAEWVGPFYPKRPVADRLRFYTGHFPIVEVDSTFYRLPPVAMARSWAKRTPSKFQFAVKFPQSITHEKRLVGAGPELGDFLAVLEPLRESQKLLAALVQLPPSLTFDSKIVRTFYESLPDDLPVAVEFRERSWLSDESVGLLKEFDLADVVVDEPLLPVRLGGTSRFSYVRFHGFGSPVWYDYTYSRKELEAWAPRLKELAESSETVYAFFNNHFRGDAPTNAKTIGEMLELPPPPWASRLMP